MNLSVRCTCRERHLACSTSTTDSHRNGERCVGAGNRSGPAPLVLGSIKSLDQQLVDFWLFLDVHTQQLVCDDVDDVDDDVDHGLQDALVPKFALVSIAHLQDLVDASGNFAQHSGAVRSSRSLLARQRSRRRPSRIHEFRYHVWITRSSELWIDGNSGYVSLLSHSRSVRQHSRSRSIPGVHRLSS